MQAAFCSLCFFQGQTRNLLWPQCPEDASSPGGEVRKDLLRGAHGKNERRKRSSWDYGSVGEEKEVFLFSGMRDEGKKKKGGKHHFFARDERIRFRQLIYLPAMPRKITHFYTSQDAAKAARLEGRSGGDAAASAAGRLRPYFCSSTGAHLLTTDADLDDERSPLPRRRTDGALVLDEAKHTVRLYLVDGGVKVVSRRGGVREKQLRLCVACDAGPMPDVGVGGGGGGEKTSCSSATAAASSTTILLPVAYRTDARSKLLYILPGAVTSLAGGGVLPEEALAEAAAAAVAVASAAGTTLSSSGSDANSRKQLALARRHQRLQRQTLLPPPSCVLPLRGGGCQASILILQGGEGRGNEREAAGAAAAASAPRFVGVTPDAFVFLSSRSARVPSAAADEQAIEAAREALGCRRSQLAMQRGASLISSKSGGVGVGGSGGGKRRRDGDEGEAQPTAAAATPHCSRLLLVTGIPPLAVFEKLVTACEKRRS